MSTELEKARQNLVGAIQDVAKRAEVEGLLEDQKKRGKTRRNRDDVLWYEILLSFSTWGGSDGSILVTEEENYSEVTYSTIKFMNSDERVQHFEQAFLNSNVRYPYQKAQYLTMIVESIEKMGGPEAAWEQFRGAEGKDAKIEFLKDFKGIGDKYARNIGMDLHHPDFHDSIAIDRRIKNISEDLGIEFNKYECHEQFYCTVAEELSMTPWELDRLLYHFADEIQAKL